ncbi:LacI family DNA-binding transcriptional regulator [Vallitalea okinawensis]|uniref:LacI family DNA-binding transcriptional regulator n=1 Tax=Vallitalea okinawensis TaxID=2078660 RepID=UPI000CFDF4F2|nr:LacI family DNA-binding transcriptional regulator [Vallitalea okinawensis]
MKKLSMKDIAQLSGVSIKTVSRVLNNSEQVKEETKEKVMAVVREHGYQRNIVAKSLKEKKTNTIMIFIDRHKGDYWGIWHTRMLNEIMRRAKAMGYKVVISPSNAEMHLEDETDGFSLLASGLADGAVIFDNVRNDVRIDFLNKHEIPYVVVGKNVDEAGSKYVDLNNYEAGYMGGKYLINKGYDSICFLVGREEYIVTQERVNGFKAAAKKYGAKDIQVIYGINTMKKAYETVRRNHEGHPCTAYFVSGDERAIGVYRALHELGIDIPSDIAVLGIDNIPICDYLYPSLSSISQPIESFCYYIMDILVEQICETTSRVEDKKVILPFELIERESTT